ncbi:hypothetical protein HMPREF3033_00880 [Veillonellaceae bacterium DNF00751]|nr:hypothetical protein HMPREF3033_00880 [Veillonellaceae bacterium DNF00751]
MCIISISIFHVFIHTSRTFYFLIQNMFFCYLYYNSRPMIPQYIR